MNCARLVDKVLEAVALLQVLSSGRDTDTDPCPETTEAEVAVDVLPATFHVTFDGVLGRDPPFKLWNALLFVESGDEGRRQCDDSGACSDADAPALTEDARSSGVARPPAPPTPTAPSPSP